MLTRQAESYPEIKAICMRLLAIREHSQKELLDKLQAKGFARDAILPVLAELTEQGWQSDVRYAESYARQRIRKGFGPLAVAHELRQNGVTGVNLDEIMQTIAGSWLDLLVQVYAKKYKQDKCLDRKEWAKRSRFLLQRGFPGDMVGTLLDHLNITLK